MSAASWKKMFTQLNAKPAKKKKYIRFNSPKERSCGVSLRECKNCGRVRAHIRKYGLHLCRQCFRDLAIDLGFKKYS